MPRPVHFELPADDPERSVRFYEQVFGWKIQKWDGPMEYWLVTTGETGEIGIDGGIYRRDPNFEGQCNTIGVEDLDASVAAVEAGGGKLLRPKSPVPGMGWLAYCLDTEGNPFGMMQMDPSAG
jgi:predicted enzyme related to lactoylglutathione lyase